MFSRTLHYIFKDRFYERLALRATAIWKWTLIQEPRYMYRARWALTFQNCIETIYSKASSFEVFGFWKEPCNYRENRVAWGWKNLKIEHARLVHSVLFERTCLFIRDLRVCSFHVETILFLNLEIVAILNSTVDCSHFENLRKPLALSIGSIQFCWTVI